MLLHRTRKSQKAVSFKKSSSTDPADHDFWSANEDFLKITKWPNGKYVHDHDLCPWTPLRLCPINPYYRLVLCSTLAKSIFTPCTLPPAVLKHSQLPKTAKYKFNFIYEVSPNYHENTIDIYSTIIMKAYILISYYCLSLYIL